MAQSINHNPDDLIDTVKLQANNKESLLEIVQDFKWLLDNKINKRRIADNLITLYKLDELTEINPETLADLYVIYLGTVIYEAAKYAGQSSESHDNMGTHNRANKNTIKIPHFNGEHVTEFIRRNSDGHWQLCRVGDKGTVSIQDITWYDAEIRVKEVLTEHSVLQEVVSVLNEDKKYMDEDKTRVAADIIDAIAREVA
ncbi:MAG: hypothetical protein [Bacteriophage sp.]|nr:MAG: hypothetical protein [Bacteriophage sp.]